MSLEVMVRKEGAAEVSRKVRRVLVTGAAGCVGTYLVDELLGRGYEVIAADRPGVPVAQAGREGLEVLGVDLADPEAAAAAVRGADAVVHAAAIVDISMGFDVLRRVNLEAVRALYDEARRQGCASFVFLSTGALYATSGVAPGERLHEGSPVEAKNDYERTKLWAEEYLQSRPAGGPRVSILRPALIFGPRGKVLGAALATAAPMIGRWLGRVPRFAGGPRNNWVHAQDVARAALFLLESQQPEGGIFNVANDDALSIGELLTTALEVGGLKIGSSTLTLSAPLLRLLQAALQQAPLADVLNTLLGRQWRRLCEGAAAEPMLQARLDREALVFLGGDVVFDNSRLKAAGFELRHPRFEPAWRETVQWYRQAGWLPAEPEAPRRKAFRFSETMVGSVCLDDGQERPFRFSVTAAAASQSGFWLRGEPLQLEGVADIEGLATGQPAVGTLDLAPWLRRELVYELKFASDSGETLRYFGRKRIRHLRPVSSWTTLRGQLLQSGMPAGAATLRFRLRDLPGLLASARPW
jgi:nucleoside-diphosphate-sugar epimerase